MAPHSSILAWKIPWTEEPGRLQSMGSQGVRWASVHGVTKSGTRLSTPDSLECPEVCIALLVAGPGLSWFQSSVRPVKQDYGFLLIVSAPWGFRS